MFIVNKDSFRLLRRDGEYERCIIEDSAIVRLNTNLIFDPVLQLDNKIFIVKEYNEIRSKGILNSKINRQIKGKGQVVFVQKEEDYYLQQVVVGQVGYNAIIQDMELFSEKELKIGSDLTLGKKSLKILKRTKMLFNVDSIALFHYVCQVA